MKSALPLDSHTHPSAFTPSAAPAPSDSCRALIGLWTASFICGVPAITMLSLMHWDFVDIVWKSVVGDFLLTLAVACLGFAFALQADPLLQSILSTGRFQGLGLTLEQGRERCVAHARRVSIYGAAVILLLALWVGLWVGLAFNYRAAGDRSTVLSSIGIFTTICVVPAIFVLAVVAIFVGCLTAVSPQHALFFPGFYRLITRRVYLFSLPLLIAHFVVMCFFGIVLGWTGAFNLAVALAVFIRLRFIIPQASADQVLGYPPSGLPSSFGPTLGDGDAYVKTDRERDLEEGAGSLSPSVTITPPASAGLIR